MLDYAAIFQQGLAYDEFLARHGTDEHRRRWRAVFDAVRLSESQRALLAGFHRRMPVLVMAGAWCGDCVEQCPILEQFQQATSAIELRFIDRDANESLKVELTTCGAPRVPTAVFLSEDFHFVHRFGDRTLARYRRLAQAQLGAACPTGLVVPDGEQLAAVTQDWLDEFERAQLILRTSARLRALHGD